MSPTFSLGKKIFLEHRQQHVAYPVSSVRSSSGVPQGITLGPLLFICFINNLPTLVNSQIRLYADDILLFRQIHSIEDSLVLQRDLNALMKWSEDWQMFFNFSKCVHLKITNRLT